MLVSLKEVGKYVDLNGLTPEEIANKLTDAGIEVEEIKYLSTATNLVIGEVLSSINHPSSDHLHLCKVDIKDEILDIVCGAPNCRKGLKVIVAKVGSKLPGGEIKESIIRGEPSKGMLCSLKELGVEDKYLTLEQINGIEELPSDAKVGDTNVLSYLGLDDVILNLKLLANRSDCFALFNVAKEIGALFHKEVKLPEYKDEGTFVSDFKVGSETINCPSFYAKVIKGIEVKDSPKWLKEVLRSQGIRSIDNIVDIGNYVMLLTGQPMHAYDAKTFANGKFEVRLANKGEKLTLLNEKEVDLDPKDIIITDGKKPVMMAGVMGGLDSEITSETTDVILESAIFDPTLVRKAALRHANRTEASSRYEKGVNWDATEKAINMAALLLRNDADATVDEGILKATDQKREPVVVKTTASYLNKVLGTKLSVDEIVEIFDRLCFKVDVDGDNLAVHVPNRRWDISIPADLVEEVGRLYGYDNLESTQPVLPETHGGYSEKEEMMRRMKAIVEGQGLMEAISYSLTSPEKAVRYTKDPKELVEVKSPLNSSRSAMRENLMTGLVDAASYNFARKQTQLALFEQGRTYDHDGGKFNEHEHLAALYSGNTFAENWQHLTQKVDFYFVKGQLTNLFAAVGIDLDKVVYKAEGIQGMHPTRTAGIYIDKQYVGMIGMIAHAVTIADKALRGSELYGYEIDLDTIIPMLTKGVTAVPAPKFPAIQRDLSLLVDKPVTNQEIENVIKSNAGKYLTELKVIDVYAGAHIDVGKKSIAYNLTFLNRKDTLTDDVVNNAMDKIVAALENDLAIKVR